MIRWITVAALIAAPACYDQATPGGVYACERDEDCGVGEVCTSTPQFPDRLICANVVGPGPGADADGGQVTPDAEGEVVAPHAVDLTGPWRGFFHDRSSRLFMLITQEDHAITARVTDDEYGDWNDEICEGEVAGAVMTCGFYFEDSGGTPWLVETELRWVEATGALTGTWINHKFPWLSSDITFTRYDPP